MMMDYVNLFVELVAMPIVSPKDNNYYTFIPIINVQLGVAVDCFI